MIFKEIYIKKEKYIERKKIKLKKTFYFSIQR
jgi:hypothetical protein